MAESETVLLRSRALRLIAALLVIAAVYLARPILVPFALSLLLSVLLAPFVRVLERVGLGRAPSVLTISSLAFAAVLGVGWLVLVQARDVAENIPVYRENIAEKVKDLHESLDATLGRASRAVQELREEIAAPHPPAEPSPPAPKHELQVLPPRLPEPQTGHESTTAATKKPVKVELVPKDAAALAAITRTIGSAVRPLVTAGVAFVFVVFILVWREDLRDRVIRVFGGEDVNYSTQALNETTQSVARYLTMLFVINGLNGAVVALGLWIIGLPNALLWGLLFALLRFMPLVGTLTAAALPILLALAVFDAWSYAVLVVALFVIVDALSSNVLEPVLYGAHTAASPMAVLVAVVVWTWLWGPVGLILAVPLTVSLVALGKYVPELSFLTILLGNQPALPPDLRLYQRLLAGDPVAARKVIDKELASAPTVDVFEHVILGAMVWAKSDHNRGALDESREGFLREALAELIAHVHDRALQERRVNGAGAQALPCDVPALCVPAFGRYDEMAAQILADVLIEDGLAARAVSRKLLAGELLEAVHSEHARIVCITAIGDDGKSRARYLVKRLLKEQDDLKIVVGLWGTSAMDSNAAKAFALAGRVDVAFSLADVRNMVEQHALSVALKDCGVQEHAAAPS